MIETKKLIKYSNIAGFPMYIKDEKLIVKNGKNLPYNLKEQITIHKDEIMQLLKGGWTP